MKPENDMAAVQMAGLVLVQLAGRLEMLIDSAGYAAISGDHQDFTVTSFDDEWNEEEE